MAAEAPASETLEASRSFETFYDAESRTLFRRLWLVTGNRAEAEELMQDAFLRVWERWDQVGAMDDPVGYLYRTAMNLFRKRYRRALLAIRRSIGLAPSRDDFADADDRDDRAAGALDATAASARCPRADRDARVQPQRGRARAWGAGLHDPVPLAPGS